MWKTKITQTEISNTLPWEFASYTNTGIILCTLISYRLYTDDWASKFLTRVTFQAPWGGGVKLFELCCWTTSGKVNFHCHLSEYYYPLLTIVLTLLFPMLPFNPPEYLLGAEYARRKSVSQSLTMNWNSSILRWRKMVVTSMLHVTL